MNIGKTQSFGAKIFIFTTLIVLAVVAFITSKNSLYLRENLSRQYQSSLIDSTQLLGEKILSMLTRWDNRLSYFSQALLQTRPEERRDLVKSFLEAEKGLLALAVLQVEGDKTVEIAKYPGDSDSQQIARISKRLDKKEILVMRHPTRSDAAVMLRRINIRGSSKAIITILFFEKSVLPFQGLADQKINIFLLDAGFRDLITGLRYSTAVNQGAFGKKAQKVMKGDLGSGYLGELRQHGDRYFVAYHHLPGYPLILVIHQDASAIDRSIREFVLDMLRWTVFFVLVAIFIASTLIRTLVSNLRELSAATHLIGEGRFDKVVPVRSRDEIGQLSESFNLMTRKIMGLLAAEHEKAVLDQELSMAQTVQNTFFKSDIANAHNLTIASFYQPASKCGGDWWGHFSLKTGKELVVIADATGHGVPAALVTAIAYATTNVIVEQINAGAFSDSNPAGLLKGLNDLLNQTLHGRLCMSFIAMVIDTRESRIVFSNGGHPFPILIPRDPNDNRLKQKEKKIPFLFLLQQKKSTSIVGIDPSSSFYNEEVQIKPGDKIIIYTDGLTEAEDKDGKQWGSKGFQKLLKKHAYDPCINLRDTVVQDVVQFNAKAMQFDDDVTLVIMEFLQSEAAAA